ncbi:endoribonuclease Dicer homolog 2-like protein isoform X1, partial [Tanacetum coccineum]
YHFYSINLNKKFEYDIPLQDIVLGVNTELELDNGRLLFDLDADRGSIAVSITYIGTSLLTSAQITISTQFQMTLLRVLLDRNITKLFQSVGQFNANKDLMAFDYLLLPTEGVNRTPVVIDWVSVRSVSFPYLAEEQSSNAGVELPAEVCYILMSPISISTFYSYSFVPSIMHRIESYLIALNLKKMHLDCGQQKGNVPAFKVLEAITTKKCLERFHLESFETLGDSFLKYAASQQLFKSLQDQHEGILSSRREKIISNDSLCRLGCNCNLPGFIRNEPFDPKTWSVPGDRYNILKLEEEVLSSKRKVYIGNKRTLKKKVVLSAEALLVFFLTKGENGRSIFYELAWNKG